MRNRVQIQRAGITSFCVILTLILFSLHPDTAFSQRQMTRAMSKVQINSMVGENGVVLNDITLKPGDPAMIIILDGRNLQNVKNAQLFKSNSVVGQSDVEVKILSASPTRLKLSVRAKTNRFSGSGFYLRLLDSKRNRLVDARNSQFHLGTGKVSAVAAKQQITPTKTATTRTAHTTKQATTPGTKTTAATRATVPRTTTGRTTTPGTKTPVATRTKTPKTTTPARPSPTTGKTPVPGAKTPARTTPGRNPAMPIPSGAPQITSIEDINGNVFEAAEIPIALGGQPTILILKGNNLGSVKNAQLFYNQNRVVHKDVQVRILETEPTQLKVSIQPQKTNIRKTGYHIQLQDAKQNRLTELKVAKFNFRKATAATVPRQAMPGNIIQGSNRPTELPYISSWTPSPALVGFEIKLTGRDIDTEWFEVKLGNQLLEIISKADNEIKARLPDQRVTADLSVGYGSVETEYVLEYDYRVKGEPLIQSVIPNSFSEGQQVTVTGQDLDVARPLIVIPQSQNTADLHFLRLGNNTELTGDNFLYVNFWNVNDAGTSITFQAEKLFHIPLSRLGGPTLMDPHPSTVYGRLRFINPMDEAIFTTASSAPVTYTSTTDLVISEVFNPNWTSHPDFIILKEDDPWHNRINVVGQGLDQDDLVVNLGNINLYTAGEAGYSGFDFDTGRLNIPLNAQTNSLTFHWNGNTTVSDVITPLSWPKFTPSTMNILGPNESSIFEIELDQTYTLQGWYLKPSGVADLTYELKLLGFNQHTSQVWNVDYQLVSHTQSMIQFKVAKLGTLPEDYESLNIFGGGDFRNTITLYAIYGGQEWPLFKRNYILVNPAE